MERIRISIPVAFLVENALTSGLDTENIIRELEQGNYATILKNAKDPEMDFADRLQTAKDVGDDWARALRDGYEFKFLHIGGLKRLLSFRYHKEIDKDYVQEELSLRHLHLNLEEIELLRSMISRQWYITEETADATGKSNSLIEIRIDLRNQESI
ncbi:hypothetical protein D3C77_447110 [compost metagenome]